MESKQFCSVKLLPSPGAVHAHISSIHPFHNVSQIPISSQHDAYFTTVFNRHVSFIALISSILSLQFPISSQHDAYFTTVFNRHVSFI